MNTNNASKRAISFIILGGGSWDISALDKAGLGGTEATVLRIAHGLTNDFDVYIAQENRNANNRILLNNVTYCNLEQLDQVKLDSIILIANYKRAIDIAKRFSPAKTYLWLHNVPRWKVGLHACLYAKYSIDLIGVSDWHVSTIKNTISKFSFFCRKPTPKVHKIFNPISDEIAPNSTERKQNKLIFISSPHKGLNEVIEKFKAIQQEFPDLELYVANPGYNKLPEELESKIHYLGELPHAEVLRHLRESFCVFYPQTSHKETFGLVFAESNAVGTPVLAHNFGAAKEILGDEQQSIDCSDLARIESTILEWKKNYPQISVNSKFKLSNVVEEWKKLLA